MTKIEIGKELILKNVLSLRKKMTQPEINDEVMKIKDYFNKNNINVAGPIITTTYAINANLLDMEILIPMDREVDLPTYYTFKPIFKLFNSLYCRHKGDPEKLQEVYNEMMTFIQKNKLQQITTGYNVTVNEVMPGMSIDELMIDVYVGVSNNIL